ncbi:MAG: protein kinase, partial [Planctomycetes bacterium]|nr:protein kinase [Planctomycetota bacterium]
MAGKYKVLKILGQGGFGSVFVVEMTKGIIGDRLAMKILPAEFSKNTMLREQFLNEIRVAMKMVDAHIVQIRDVGITEGAPEKGEGLLYYTMDYVDGKTLGALIKEDGPLRIWRALRIARRLLPALKVAHNAGIIHRDLKPANIMIEVVGEKELPRILDFGIATAVIADTELDNSLEGGLKDKKGFVGSPYYMPPEQFQAVDMGFYTDLYSLGEILYECLTGQKPYTGRTAKEVYKKIKQGPPTPIDELQPAVGKVPGLTEMITKSLERNPERRFQSAKEFFETLTDVMSGKNEEPPPQPKAGTAPLQRPSKRRIPAAPIRRASVGRKSMSVSTIHGRLSTRRRSSRGGMVLILLGLAAFGMLGLAFKDQLLEVIQKVSEDPEASSPVTGRTPEAEPEEQGSSTSPPAGSEKTAPEKVPAVEQPQPEAAKPSTAERMKEIRQQLAERIEVHLNAGDAAIKRKEWDTASGEADVVLGIESDHAEALLLKARVMLNTNRSIQAIVTLEAALKSVKDEDVRIEILRNLAIGHTRLQTPDWNLAAAKLEEAVALDLTNEPAANLLVFAYQELKQG